MGLSNSGYKYSNYKLLITPIRRLITLLTKSPDPPRSIGLALPMTRGRAENAAAHRKQPELGEAGATKPHRV